MPRMLPPGEQERSQPPVSSASMALTAHQQQFLALSQALNHVLPIKLDRSNFLLWQTQMENVIYANGIEDFLDGTVTVPPEHLPGQATLNPDFQLWRRKDRLILSWLFSSLTPELMSHLVGHRTSASAWAALNQLYSSTLNARIMQLHLQLQTIKKAGLSMMDYILKIKSFSDQLAAISEKVSERDQVLHLLAGLGAEYNSFVVSITSKSKSVTFDHVSSLL